jgi:DNA adenine methylase
MHASPLRYPGGKAKLAPFLGEAVRLNGVSYGTFAEAFAGGAGAALELLFSQAVTNVALNDADPLIFAIWKAILMDPKRFQRRIARAPLTVNYWRTRKKIVRRNESKLRDEIFEVGWSAFYLNRCNRSGVFDAGPIGGHDQTGNYLIDARFNREGLKKRIERIADYSHAIRVYNLDAVEFLRRIQYERGFRRDQTVVYLDPPYFLKGPTLYAHYFTRPQHERLSQFLNATAKFRWIVSYDDVSEIHALYAKQAVNIHNMCYQVHTRKEGRELIVSSSNCDLPKARSFLSSAGDVSSSLVKYAVQ